MQNISLEIKVLEGFPPSPLIVAFVCVALVGLALVPLLPVKLNPHGHYPASRCVSVCRHFGTRGGNDSYQQTGGDACPRERDSGYLFYFRKRVGQYQRESG